MRITDRWMNFSRWSISVLMNDRGIPTFLHLRISWPVVIMRNRGIPIVWLWRMINFIVMSRMYLVDVLVDVLVVGNISKYSAFLTWFFQGDLVGPLGLTPAIVLVAERVP